MGSLGISHVWGATVAPSPSTSNLVNGCLIVSVSLIRARASARGRACAGGRARVRAGGQRAMGHDDLRPRRKFEILKALKFGYNFAHT